MVTAKKEEGGEAKIFGGKKYAERKMFPKEGKNMKEGEKKKKKRIT